MFDYFAQICCHHKLTMSNNYRSKNWSKHCSGSIFLLNEFQTYLDSKGKQGINPDLSDPIQICPLYHKHSSVFREYSESNFPKNFIRTSTNFKVSRKKSGTRSSGKKLSNFLKHCQKLLQCTHSFCLSYCKANLIKKTNRLHQKDPRQ